MGGYLFKSKPRLAFEQRWQKALERAGLPHFKMASYVHHLGLFSDLPPGKRTALKTELIALVGDHALHGLAITMNEADYNFWFDNGSGTGNAFTLCHWQVLAGIRNWI